MAVCVLTGVHRLFSSNCSVRQQFFLGNATYVGAGKNGRLIEGEATAHITPVSVIVSEPTAPNAAQAAPTQLAFVVNRTVGFLRAGASVSFTNSYCTVDVRSLSCVLFCF